MQPWNGGRTRPTSATIEADVAQAEKFAELVRANQARLAANLKASYDFIVCGSGSSGSVVARRLSEAGTASVLLLEAGGSDEVESVADASLWASNIGSERDWGFVTEPCAHVGGRTFREAMGKVLGGGSSINAMIWSRGHKSDWDHFANESGDPAWSYQSVLEIYRRIEDWHGEPDRARRGVGGPLFIQPTPAYSPLSEAILAAENARGMPTFADQNGAMMEGDGGSAFLNLCIRDGKRRSVYRGYVYPQMAEPNLTVLTGALVTRVLFENTRAIGVEVVLDGQTRRFLAGSEVVLSLGAFHTPKVLMQSGIGDRDELVPHGIAPVENLPGVGKSLQTHLRADSCLWEYAGDAARVAGIMTTAFHKTDPALDGPNTQIFQSEIAPLTPDPRLGDRCWSLAPILVRPKSRGAVRLTGADPADPIAIEGGFLTHADDLRALHQSVELCREIGNSAGLHAFRKTEVLPGNVHGPALDDIIRDQLGMGWHQSCTAKMGRDEMSVVDGVLKVHGIKGLRIADASIMPRVTSGNTMAPCVVIGERAGDLLRAEHGV
jgi:choline dehydrogenase